MAEKLGIGVLFALIMLLGCKNFKEMQEELDELKTKGRISEDDYNIIIRKLNELKGQVLK